MLKEIQETVEELQTWLQSHANTMSQKISICLSEQQNAASNLLSKFPMRMSVLASPL